MSDTSTADAPAEGGDAPTGDDDLGDSGTKALEAFKVRAREAEKRAKATEKANADLQARLASLEEGNKSEQEKALEKARSEATSAATKEVTSKANARIALAEVKAAAASKVDDLDVAVAVLEKRHDFAEFVDEDGEVDGAAIAAAIDALLNEKPKLAAKGGRPIGDIGQGPRQNGTALDPRAADIAQIEADLKAGSRRRT